MADNNSKIIFEELSKTLKYVDKDGKMQTDKAGKALIENISRLYSQVLDNRGLNLQEPLSAYMNNINKRNDRASLDPPYVGKTYVFMTRPNLNLSPLNLKVNSAINMYSSIPLYRSILKYLTYPDNPIIPLDDNILDREHSNHEFTPFIPMVTNLCTELSGGKDLTIETKETDGDFAGNKLTYATGMDDSLSIGELTMSFQDATYSPILVMAIVLAMYTHEVCKGGIMPHADSIIYRQIDYTSSIYTFMLDRDQSTILRFSKYTGCFLRSIPFNNIQHSTEIDMNILKNIQLTFSYNFYEAMTPNILADLNYLSFKYYLKNFGNTPEAALSNIGYWKDSLYKMPGKIISSKTFRNGDFRLGSKEEKRPDAAYDGSLYDPFNDSTYNPDNNSFDHQRQNFGLIPYVIGNQLMLL